MSLRADWRTIDTDLLVIGGGVAGSMAAIPALEAGLDVVVCEKGRVLDNCGSVGCGVDHYLTVMESGPEWDTPEFLLRHLPQLTDGIVDMAVASRVIHEMPRILRKIEGMGVDFKDPRTGDYSRHRSFGLPGAYHINFDGTDFKRKIGKHVRAGKATVLMRTMAVQLLVEENRAYGALAFNFRTGEWIAIRAKAVALTAGDVNRLSENASGLAFDSWHFPYNTGDAQAMAFRAGAALTNMEFTEATLTPKGFSAQGLNAVVSMGAYFLNKHGERFMFRYDEKGENARRAVLADAVINEYLLGNGPIYLDCRHLPEEELDHMEETLQVDRYTLPAFYRQKGVSFRTDLIEVSISELSIRRSGVYFRGSGLAVDTTGETSVEGLFAAGDCASVSGGIAGAAVLGHIAGEGAVVRMRATYGARPDIDWADAERIRAEAEAALGRAGGMPWKAFEGTIRRTVSDYVGVRRSERGLRLALETLAALAVKEGELAASDLHGLMRVQESRNIRLNTEIMATAALARTETRTRSAHRRVDHPEPDNENWRKFVLVEKGPDGRPSVRAIDAGRPLADSFARRSQSQTEGSLPYAAGL
ncbi:FAD-binding protein [Propylenella binzhouense]|uniref:FAD-binding protein n=1 Tax=Propylenella binzhouense TaxID=2555902 RepID=A0A964T3Q1_9HYPH|nr:FAD-binding protein [Propylenella binzhouense]MYZ47936.1 FAD-binding protein [Propylenella binzhouense]